MEILIFDTHWPLSAIIYPFTCSAIPVKAAFLHWENLVTQRAIEQVPLKSSSLEIIDSVNEILKNKKKLNKPINIKYADTRIILYVMLIIEDIFRVSH